MKREVKKKKKAMAVLLLVSVLVAVSFGSVYYVDPIHGTNSSVCGPALSPCSSLRLAMQQAVDNDEIVLVDGSMVSGPDNMGFNITQRNLKVSCSKTSTNSDGCVILGSKSLQLAFSTSASLQLSEGPLFTAVRFIDALVVVGGCGAVFNGCVFNSGSDYIGGLAYFGRAPGTSHPSIGLALLECSFFRTGLVVLNGYVNIQGTFWSSPAGAKQSGINLDGDVILEGQQLSNLASALLIRSTASGTIQISDSTISGNVDGKSIDINNAAANVFISGSTFKSQPGIRVAGGASLQIFSSSFSDGVQVPYISSVNASVVLANVSFSNMKGAPCIVCSNSAFVSISGGSFSDNSNEIMASLVDLSTKCLLDMSGPQPSLLKNSFPQISCASGQLKADKSWANSVVCSSCGWDYCVSQGKGGNGLLIALLVVACLGVVAISAVLGRWFWFVYRKRITRRLEYQNIQEGHGMDDL